MIALIIIIVLFFVLFVVLLYNILVKKYTTKEKPKALTEKPKQEDNAKKEEKVDEIPEILQEVTRGNYLLELSQQDGDGSLEEMMTENPTIEKPKPEFKPITLDDEMEDEPLTTDDILAKMDGNEQTPLQQEIRKLSPEMKALLISNILNKKDKF